jgi:hypothetical protein
MTSTRTVVLHYSRGSARRALHYYRRSIYIFSTTVTFSLLVLHSSNKDKDTDQHRTTGPTLVGRTDIFTIVITQ